MWVNVYEADQAKVLVGQEIEIRFPFLDKTVRSKVEYIASEVSKDTRAILLRTSVPNIDGKLKADMLVRAALRIPPVAGQTVIPRQAMVVMNGAEYAFVQKAERSGEGVEQFERRPLVVAEERDDHVVVQSGLANRAITLHRTGPWCWHSSTKISRWLRPECRSNEPSI